MINEDVTAGQHITRILPPDLAGHWAWECHLGDDDGSGYDDPDEVLEAATEHGQLAADSHRPSWADIDEGQGYEGF